MDQVTATSASQGGIDAARIADLRRTEAAAFRKARPKSEARIGNGIEGFLGGVPMHWMSDWPTPFPILVERAKGATIVDIDGNALDDFCLGDTGSMFGHSPPPVARAIRRQAARGLTYMLPSEDALGLGRLLEAHFGLPFWQIATTATDANRFALRVARAVTGRVFWRLDSESAGQGRPVETIVRATVEIPEAGLNLDFTIRRNTDTAFPASHIIGLRFTSTGDPATQTVKEVGVPQIMS